MGNFFNINLFFLNKMSMNEKALPVQGLDFIKGESVDLSFSKPPGKVIVLEYWATWCPPCRNSIPHLTQLQKQYPNVIFIGITNEGKAQAAPFVQQMGSQMDYRVALDPYGSAQGYMQKYQMRGIPSAFVIDKKGMIRWKGHPMEGDFASCIARCDAESFFDAASLANVTADDLSQKGVKELKQIISALGGDFRDCVEKQDLVRRVLELKK